MRQQPLAVSAAGRARPPPLGGLRARGAARPRTVPADRRAPVPAHPVRPRLLLVPHLEVGGGAIDMTADQLAGLQTYATLLADYLPRRRWFPAKGREFSVVSVSGLPWFEHEGSEDGRRSRIELVGVAFSDGTTETYQVPV